MTHYIDIPLLRPHWCSEDGRGAHFDENTRCLRMHKKYYEFVERLTWDDDDDLKDAHCILPFIPSEFYISYATEKYPDNADLKAKVDECTLQNLLDLVFSGGSEEYEIYVIQSLKFDTVTNRVIPTWVEE